MPENSNYTCEIILPDRVYEIFPLVQDFLDTIAETSDNKIEGKDFIAEFILQKMQLWVVRNNNEICGVTITEILRHPRKQVCACIGVTGNNVSEWIHLIKHVEFWAFSLGCKTMTNIGRPGYEKLLAPHGYKKTHVFLEKPLEFYDA